MSLNLIPDVTVFATMQNRRIQQNSVFKVESYCEQLYLRDLRLVCYFLTKLQKQATVAITMSKDIFSSFFKLPCGQQP